MAQIAKMVGCIASMEAEPLASAALASPAVAEVVDAPRRAPGSADRMAYMADLLLELAEMAAAEDHATLAGLLTLAHHEALTKSTSA